MIKAFDLEIHARKLALADQTEGTIKAIRRMVESQQAFSEPASRSMPSLLTSAKMGWKVCPTGSNLDLSHQIAGCEWNDLVAGYVTQAETFKVTWQNLTGAVVDGNHKPDFLALHIVPQTPATGWVPATFQEIKPSAELEQQRAQGKGRYVFDDQTGRWRSPGAEEAAKNIYGFGYEVITERELDSLLARNVNYLWDYTRANTPRVPRNVVEAVQGFLATNQGITVADLLREVGSLTRDRFFTMIVHGQVFVPLDEEDLGISARVRVYTDQVVAEAHKTIIRTQNHELLATRPPLLATGEQLQMDQVIYDVLDGSGDVVRLRDEALGVKPMRREHLFRLHRDGRLRSLGIPSDNEKRIRTVLQTTTAEQLVTAMERLKPIELYLTTNKRRAAPGEQSLRPADRYWLNKARRGAASHGFPLIECIDRIRCRGGRTKKIGPAREKVITNAINRYYLIPEAGTKSAIYLAYAKDCKEANVSPVSYKTFSLRLKALPPDLVALKQDGEMAAGQHAPPSTDEPSLTAKAQHFMQVAQMDEYVFDVASIDPELGRDLGQFWVVVMIDVFTRTVLAITVSFEEPSYALTTLPALRKCVQRWKRSPGCILTDRGAGFKESYAKAAVAMGVRPTWRPAGKARGAAQVERCGGVSNQRLAAELRGATAILVKYRRVSKTHDPAVRAVYFPEELIRLLERYFSEVYDTLPHGGLNGRSPREMRQLSLERDGERKHTHIEPDTVFEILSLPGPSRGDGTVKIQEHDGVQHDGLYYWHPKFKESEFIGTNVPMHWDPCDITHVFVFVGGKWEESVCLALRNLRRLPREQLCLSSIMIRRDRKKYRRSTLESVTAIQLLLNSVRKTEDQVQEVLRMRESAKALTLALPPVLLAAEREGSEPNGNTTRIPGFPSAYLEERQ